jgi:hypothetical protein
VVQLCLQLLNLMYKDGLAHLNYHYGDIWRNDQTMPHKVPDEQVLDNLKNLVLKFTLNYGTCIRF